MNRTALACCAKKGSISSSEFDGSKLVHSFSTQYSGVKNSAERSQGKRQESLGNFAVGRSF